MEHEEVQLVEETDLPEVKVELDEISFDYCTVYSPEVLEMTDPLSDVANEPPTSTPSTSTSTWLKITATRSIAPTHDPSQTCHICGKQFRLVAHLNKHLKRHDESKRPVCDQCGEKFVDTKSLTSHQIRQHGADPFICEECGARLVTLPGLKSHMMSHAGDTTHPKPHKCDICPASFSNKRSMQDHARTHTNERPFPCPHCTYAFKQRKELTRHIDRIHTPGYVAPIRSPCPHCDKGYTTNSFLQGHIRQVHTGERPFLCEQAGCGKGFAKNSLLTSHLKKAHKIIIQRVGGFKLPRSRRIEILAKTH
ncbi:gastrula zinc finger protein XlCGF8.2DB [Folsomia candida]|uniref:Zinc finger protein ZFP69 n=1 Tax=Folsomia candida TaxID=158441 RepID=A0A226DG20_FOLCA|nr:gastrula zinc finger protein XlCGF8.2DB [Folsomia candida]OXA43146.1 Zinc finger protein ZFP69 [Folsomia candida]